MDKLRYDSPSKDFSVIKFEDKQLGKRLERSVEYITKNLQKSILSSGQTRHDAKAFYALLSNEKFNLEHLITAYQNGPVERIRSSQMLIQDTTDINLNAHQKTENLGFASEHVRRLLTYSCIAVTKNGISLGLLMNQIYHTRKKAKSSLTHHEKIKRPIEEKESFRWLKTARDVGSKMSENVTSITVCDREGDFYELYLDLKTIGLDFVIRLLHSRKTIDGERLIQKVQHFKPCENIEISVLRNTRENIPQRTAVCAVSFGSVEILKPKKVDINQPKSYNFSVVRIFENSAAKGRME